MDDRTIQSHCGSNAFSPPAPPELCNAVNTAPEPGVWLLLIVAIVAFWIARSRK